MTEVLKWIKGMDDGGIKVDKGMHDGGIKVDKGNGWRRYKCG